MSINVKVAKKCFHCNVCLEKFHDSDAFLGHMKNLRGQLECVEPKTENESYLKESNKIENTIEKKAKM